MNIEEIKQSLRDLPPIDIPITVFVSDSDISPSDSPSPDIGRGGDFGGGGSSGDW